MGCCKSSFVCSGKRLSPAEHQALTQEVSKLRDLVTPEEQALIASRSRSLRAEVRRLKKLLDTKPVKIVAASLAGETLAELELSVNATGADLERSIFAAHRIDEKECKVAMTYESAIISWQQTLLDIGMLPGQLARVDVVKAPRPKQNPALDHALFKQAWRFAGNLGAVQDLLDKNADPNGYTYQDGDRAIHVSAGMGCTEVVRALLEARADVNVPGFDGLTPLQRCSYTPTTYWAGHFPEVQELLREHGATR